MKKFFTIVSIACLFLVKQSSAQIDTTLKEFFPLHVGDVWQYQYTDPSGFEYVGNCGPIVGDTILPDGLHYYQGCGLARLDSMLRIWQNYGGVETDTISNCQNSYAFNIYNLNEQVGTVWRTCQNLVATLCYPWFMRFDGIFTSYIFGQPREVMRFTPGAYCAGAGDTAWYGSWLLVKGIGIYHEETIEIAQRQLIGAMIDGVRYGTLVGVNEESSTMPNSFALRQNYPNPFNPTTTIEFELPEAAYVSLIVYDLLGREVSKLVNEKEQTGRYQVTFNARDLPTGAYFYALNAGRYYKTKLMSIVK